MERKKKRRKITFCLKKIHTAEWSSFDPCVDNIKFFCKIGPLNIEEIENELNIMI